MTEQPFLMRAIGTKILITPEICTGVVLKRVPSQPCTAADSGSVVQHDGAIPLKCFFRSHSRMRWVLCSTAGVVENRSGDE